MNISNVEALEEAKDIKKRIQHIIETGGDRFESRHRCKDGSIIDIEVSTNYVSTKGGRCFSFIRDITKRKRADNDLCMKNSFLKLLQVAAVAANEAVDIKDAFLPILKGICCYSGWAIGHAYIVSENNPDLLKPTEVWCLEEKKQFMEFYRVTKKTDFARGIGLPGRVLASREPIWIVDVAKDKSFLRKEVAKALKLKSGIAFPVMIGVRVVAVLEFFSIREVGPDQQFIEIMADLGILLGRTIERKQAEEGLKALNKSLEQRVVERTKELLISNDELQREIAAHKEAEDLLKENNELTQSIMDNTTAVIYLKDKDGKYILVNRQFEALFCAEKDKVIGKAVEDIFPEKIAEKLRENDDKIFKDGFPVAQEEVVDQDDGPHTYISTKFLLFDSDGAPDRICGISTDITERKESEEKLKESEEKYRKLIETAKDAIINEHNGKMVIESTEGERTKVVISLPVKA